MGLPPFIATLFSRSSRRSSTSSDPRHALGREGERLAARHLRGRGYRVLYRNFRPSRANGRAGRGEVDLVCRHGDTLVFVEVKTRRSADFAAPGEAVDRAKQRRLIAGALQWLRLLRNPEVAIRFDIVEVLVPLRGRSRARVIESAFTLPESYR